MSAARALACAALLAGCGREAPPVPPAVDASRSAARVAPADPEPAARAQRTASPELPEAFGPTRRSRAELTDGCRAEVVPVAELLWAVAMTDTSGLASVFTPAVQRQIAVVGWPRYVEQSADRFFAALGALDAGPLELTFDGDAQNGSVTVARGARHLPPFTVTRDAGGWRVAKP